MTLGSRIAILSVPLALFAVLFVIDLQVDGVRTASIKEGQESPFIGTLSPTERLRGFEVIGEPVYFTVRPPSSEYETVTVRVTLDPMTADVVEVGPLADPFSRAFDLRPLYHGLLEGLSWPREIYANGLRYFTRDGDPISSASEVAFYHAENPVPVRLSGYEGGASSRTTKTSLRGSHRVAVYVKNEPLDVTFTFTDVNRTTGEDPLTFRVYNERDEVVYKGVTADDGNRSKDQTFSRIAVPLRIEDLPEGPYRIEWTTTSDLFLREWTTTLTKWVFLQAISFGDQVGWSDDVYGETVFTNGKDLTAETLHVEGVQTIRVGDQSFELSAPREQVYFSTTETGVLPVTIPKGDVRLTVDGVIAFTRDQFFNPEGTRLGGLADLEAREVDAILTSYQSVERVEGGVIGEQTFAIAPYVDANGVITFALSSPSVSREGKSFRVQEIEVTFTKPPLRGRALLKALRDRLPFGL